MLVKSFTRFFFANMVKVASSKRKARPILSKKTVKKLISLTKAHLKDKHALKCIPVAMKSFSDPTKTYWVTTTSCTCPDYKFRRRAKGQSCKHMRKLNISKE